MLLSVSSVKSIRASALFPQKEIVLKLTQRGQIYFSVGGFITSLSCWKLLHFHPFSEELGSLSQWNFLTPWYRLHHLVGELSSCLPADHLHTSLWLSQVLCEAAASSSCNSISGHGDDLPPSSVPFFLSWCSVYRTPNLQTKVNLYLVPEGFCVCVLLRLFIFTNRCWYRCSWYLQLFEICS